MRSARLRQTRGPFTCKRSTAEQPPRKRPEVDPEKTPLAVRPLGGLDDVARVSTQTLTRAIQQRNLFQAEPHPLRDGRIDRYLWIVLPLCAHPPAGIEPRRGARLRRSQGLISSLDATTAAGSLRVVAPLRTTGQTYQWYVPGENRMVCPSRRHRLGTRTFGTLVVAEYTDAPLRVISTVYAVAFATGAHASSRLDEAPLTPACDVAEVVLACVMRGRVETAGLAVLPAVAAVAFGEAGGGGGVAAASLSAAMRSPDNRSPTKTPKLPAAERATAAAATVSSRRAPIRLGACPAIWVRTAGSASAGCGLTVPSL